MYTDFRGHALTTSKEMAARSCAKAMDHYMQRKSDVSVYLQTALEHDPECAIAHAYQGLMLHGAKNSKYQSLVSESLSKAKQYASGLTDREQLYIEALEFASSGQLLDSVSCFESILESCPTDGFALSLCQAELFWLGDMKRSLAVSTSVAPAWNESITGYSEFLAVHAFDLEEAGQYAQAEKAGRKAVDLQPANIWATHAVTHVMYMQGRHAEGVEWISGLQNNWDDVGQMQFHVWWHKCLFHLERSEHDAVLEAYDKWVRNREHSLVQALPDLYIDLQNGSSLLWRLELAGVDVGDRWLEMAEVVASRASDMSNPFTSAHFAVIFAAVNDFKACEQLVNAIQHYVHHGEGTLTKHYARAALPAAQSAIAHRRGDYHKVIDVLYPARQYLWMMGGSHAQQDLFFQMLVDAAAKTGDILKVNALLNEIEQIGFVEPAQLNSYKVIMQSVQ